MASKTILITGCSAGGIGSALAESFQKRGLHVFATARSLGKMSHLEKLSNMTLLPLDATSQSSVQSAVESVKAATGGTLDYLVNNAGQGMIMPTLDVDIEAAKAMYDINVWGFLRVTQAFVPLLVATKGTLVNISSIAIGLHTPWMGMCFFPRHLIPIFLSYRSWENLHYLSDYEDFRAKQVSTPVPNVPCT